MSGFEIVMVIATILMSLASIVISVKTMRLNRQIRKRREAYLSEALERARRNY